MAPLDPSSIAALGNLQLKARHIVQGALTGMHRARLHGSSVEFAEHKEYSPGDEIRHIDWKAYGKVDRYYVKQFEQESQLTSHLVLDASASMGFAGHEVSKLAYAVHLLASLAYVFGRQRDRVGLSWFGAAPERDAFIPPRSRPTHTSDLFAALERVLARGAQGDDTATDALERLAELTQRRRASIVLASDLLGDDTGALERLRLLRARGHEAVVFHILDPHELELPYSGLTRFQSMEDDRDLLVDPDNIRKQYRERLHAFLQRIREACTDSGVEYHLVSTDTPIERTLIDFSSLRARLARPRRTWSF